MRRALIVAALLAMPVWAAPPAQLPVCGSCHGMQGQGIEPVGPRLAGLSADYIAGQLALFKSGARKNATMTPMAALLPTDKDVQAMAQYFASQPAPPVSKLHYRGEQVVYSDPAEKLAYQGDWSRNIPACVACHGPSGVGGGPIPRLAGQQQAYLETQLQAWRNGTRSGDQDAIMTQVAKKLTDAEIKAMAHYFAGIK
ncbi:c-type cytochrome [Gallaecimonas sp. GXIMD1310]|uniref:c-type cytochrome n=1 Tax=Gallaecimonas sp. GXIMD1310 TaxID=3131926 RepID=UPI0032453E96